MIRTDLINNTPFKKRAAVLMAALVLILSGCSKNSDSNTTTNKSDVSQYDVAFNFEDKDSFEKTSAITVNDQKIYVDQLMWYMYMTQSSLSVINDSEYYKQSYDGEITIGQYYTNIVVEKLVCDEVMYQKALAAQIAKSDQKEIETQADKMLQAVSDTDIKKYGLTKKSAVEFCSRLAYIETYKEVIFDGISIDVDELKKRYPIESFVAKNNVELLFVSYIKDNKNATTYSNDEIESRLKLIKDIYASVIEGKTDVKLDEIAKKSDKLEYKKCSYYDDFTQNQEYVEAHPDEMAVSRTVINSLENKEVGYVSEVVEDASGAYVARVLSREKEADYLQMISDRVNQIKENAYQQMVQKYVEESKVFKNTVVFEQIEVGRQ